MLVVWDMLICKIISGAGMMVIGMVLYDDGDMYDSLYVYMYDDIWYDIW